MIRFRCASCGQDHTGAPTFGWDYPLHYLVVPEAERGKRCFLTSDTCVVDDEAFYVRASLEIPIVGEAEPFAWGVWASLNEKNFVHFQELLAVAKRSHHGPFFGWLSSQIWIYPDTMNLKTQVHLRDEGNRPYIELEATDHPLAIEQRAGISRERVAEIVEKAMHPGTPPNNGVHLTRSAR